MRGFVARQDQYVARLVADERAVLADVTADVAVMLGARRFTAQDVDDPPVGTGGVTLPDGGAGPDGDPGPLEGSWPWERPVDPPDDPAVRRLLPDGSLDAEQAAEFRRLTESDLRARKTAGLRTWWEALNAPGGRSGDAVALTQAEAPAVAAALTDVRLVLADRLGVRTDDDAERLYDELAREPGEDHDARVRHAFVGIYAVLSELQETLVTAMLAHERARRGPRGRSQRG